MFRFKKSDHTLQTGFIEDEGEFYYAPENDGKLYTGGIGIFEDVNTGYQNINRGTSHLNVVVNNSELQHCYYYNPQRVRGAMTIDGHKFLFDENGEGVHGVVTDNGQEYLYNHGELVKDAFVKVGGNTYRSDSEARVIKNKLVIFDQKSGKAVFCDEDGKTYNDLGEFTFEGKDYYLSNGVLATYFTSHDDWKHEVFYSPEDFSKAKGFFTYDGSLCYADKVTGYVPYGLFEVDGKKYFARRDHRIYGSL